MKVNFNDHVYEVKDINYKQKRNLWRMSLLAFPNLENQDPNQEAYYNMLDKVEELSGLKEDSYVNAKDEKLSMAEIDLLLQEVYSQYMGLSKKDK
jgi:hypothetical protein|tara:strand:- start:514 stop:798 length:285 start_codon:yes stop_codon:yes gene_type:complete